MAIIYILICKKCQLKYIGTSGRQLQKRLSDHRGYISSQLESRATGTHFNLPGHSLADLSVNILEQTKVTQNIGGREKNTLLESLTLINMVLTKNG